MDRTRFDEIIKEEGYSEEFADRQWEVSQVVLQEKWFPEYALREALRIVSSLHPMISYRRLNDTIHIPDREKENR